MRSISTLVALLALALPAPAPAEPLLSSEDAAELAQALAEAREEQDVCYGWQVRVDDDSRGPDGIDSGSSSGPGTPVGAGVGCRLYVELRGSVSYTCGSCEAEDSSDADVTTNIPNGPSTHDLDELGLDGGDLANDKGDSVLASMVGALPLIAASRGAAPAIAAEADTTPPPARDKPTGTPWTPDWLRESWLALAACLVLVVGGSFWLRSVIQDERRKARRAARRRARGEGINKSIPPTTPAE